MTTSDRNTMVYRNPYHGYSDTDYGYNNNNNNDSSKGGGYHGQYNGHYNGHHQEEYGHHHHNGYTTQVWKIKACNV